MPGIRISASRRLPLNLRRDAPGNAPMRCTLVTCQPPISNAISIARRVKPRMCVGSSHTARGTARGTVTINLPRVLTTRRTSRNTPIGSSTCSRTSLRRALSNESFDNGNDCTVAITHRPLASAGSAWSKFMIRVDDSPHPAPKFRRRRPRVSPSVGPAEVRD